MRLVPLLLAALAVIAMIVPAGPPPVTAFCHASFSLARARLCARRLDNRMAASGKR